MGKRYIDAENIKLKGISVFDQNLEMLIPLSDVRKSLQMTPTADVQEVRHGRWELIAKNVSKCTVCGCARNIKTQFGWNFCPVCGAKMGGDER